MDNSVEAYRGYIERIFLQDSEIFAFDSIQANPTLCIKTPSAPQHLALIPESLTIYMRIGE
jgi:hypothetical protein